MKVKPREPPHRRGKRVATFGWCDSTLPDTRSLCSGKDVSRGRDTVMSHHGTGQTHTFERGGFLSSSGHSLRLRLDQTPPPPKLRAPTHRPKEAAGSCTESCKKISSRSPGCGGASRNTADTSCSQGASRRASCSCPAWQDKAQSKNRVPRGMRSLNVRALELPKPIWNDQSCQRPVQEPLVGQHKGHWALGQQTPLP